MNEICGDNRFEIIAKAKADLLDATNIDTSEDEMKVLDSFLFRCWQMGWLDRYDRKTEPSNSEIPNNCEHITEDGVTCAKYPACDDCLDNPLNKVKGSERLVKGNDEPTISKMEQVDKDINVRSKDEPQTCEECEHWNDTEDGCADRHGCKDEPGTDCDKGLQLFADILFDKEKSEQFLKECKALGIEPQTERSE